MNSCFNRQCKAGVVISIRHFPFGSFTEHDYFLKKVLESNYTVSTTFAVKFRLCCQECVLVFSTHMATQKKIEAGNHLMRMEAVRLCFLSPWLISFCVSLLWAGLNTEFNSNWALFIYYLVSPWMTWYRDHARLIDKGKVLAANS